MPPSLLKYGRSKDDLPPPYPGSSSSTTNSTLGRYLQTCISVADSTIPKKDDTESRIDEATALEQYVEVCPHEKLYFPRLQKIVNLPAFKNSTGINGLTRESTKHYNVTETPDSYHCVVENADDRLPCYAYGEINFFYARWYDSLEWTGPHPGVLLQSDWCLWLEHFPREIATLEGVEQFYARLPVSLCPHTKLIDVVGPQRLLHSIQSYRRILDPVLDYELRRLKPVREECKSCHSSFQVKLFDDGLLRVTCVRLLGNADSPKDPIWLSQ
ncbi:MAG: hypothetical protein LQ349_005758 [Xanthoria aureola]|nr:MAG: hypothetical protein LQ349_005758 [Xanthoria aureola]